MHLAPLTVEDVYDTPPPPRIEESQHHLGSADTMISPDRGMLNSYTSSASRSAPRLVKDNSDAGLQ